MIITFLLICLAIYLVAVVPVYALTGVIFILGGLAHLLAAVLHAVLQVPAVKSARVKAAPSVERTRDNQDRLDMAFRARWIGLDNPPPETFSVDTDFPGHDKVKQN